MLYTHGHLAVIARSLSMTTCQQHLCIAPRSPWILDVLNLYCYADDIIFGSMEISFWSDNLVLSYRPAVSQRFLPVGQRNDTERHNVTWKQRCNNSTHCTDNALSSVCRPCTLISIWTFVIRTQLTKVQIEISVHGRHTEAKNAQVDLIHCILCWTNLQTRASLTLPMSAIGDVIGNCKCRRSARRLVLPPHPVEIPFVYRPSIVFKENLIIDSSDLGYL